MAKSGQLELAREPGVGAGDSSKKHVRLRTAFLMRRRTCNPVRDRWSLAGAETGEGDDADVPVAVDCISGLGAGASLMRGTRSESEWSRSAAFSASTSLSHRSVSDVSPKKACAACA
mmetsp:Transcript_82082/g.211515  ORF Transcript_82082/g.211515 Transcript_82082/m.211515 type:complete len:117 (+) Transcript_82082:321-671(+)